MEVPLEQTCIYYNFKTFEMTKSFINTINLYNQDKATFLQMVTVLRSYKRQCIPPVVETSENQIANAWKVMHKNASIDAIVYLRLFSYQRNCRWCYTCWVMNWASSRRSYQKWNIFQHKWFFDESNVSWLIIQIGIATQLSIPIFLFSKPLFTSFVDHIYLSLQNLRTQHSNYSMCD